MSRHVSQRRSPLTTAVTLVALSCACAAWACEEPATQPRDPYHAPIATWLVALHASDLTSSTAPPVRRQRMLEGLSTGPVIVLDQAYLTLDGELLLELEDGRLPEGSVGTLQPSRFSDEFTALDAPRLREALANEIKARESGDAAAFESEVIDQSCGPLVAALIVAPDVPFYTVRAVQETACALGYDSHFFVGAQPLLHDSGRDAATTSVTALTIAAYSQHELDLRDGISNSDPYDELVLGIGHDGALTLRSYGRPGPLHALPPRSAADPLERPDWLGLYNALTDLEHSSKWQEQESIVIAADGAVPFGVVVRAMDVAREQRVPAGSDDNEGARFDTFEALAAGVPVLVDHKDWESGDIVEAPLGLFPYVCFTTKHIRPALSGAP